MARRREIQNRESPKTQCEIELLSVKLFQAGKLQAFGRIRTAAFHQPIFPRIDEKIPLIVRPAVPNRVGCRAQPTQIEPLPAPVPEAD